MEETDINKVFLDTTSLVNRIFQTRERREKISGELKDKKLITSTYTISQFVKEWISCGIDLYRIIKNSKTDREILVRISDIYGKKTKKTFVKRG